MTRTLFAALALAGANLALPALAQTAPACPTGNLLYWQAFPPAASPTFRRATSSWC